MSKLLYIYGQNKNNKKKQVLKKALFETFYIYTCLVTTVIVFISFFIDV